MQSYVEECSPGKIYRALKRNSSSYDKENFYLPAQAKKRRASVVSLDGKIMHPTSPIKSGLPKGSFKIMRALSTDGAPLLVFSPSVSLDMAGLQEIKREVHYIKKAQDARLFPIGAVKLFELRDTYRFIRPEVVGKKLEYHLYDSHCRQPQYRALRLLMLAANNLQKIHCAGFVHGDIKEDNIIVDSEENPIFIDFGRSVDIGTRISEIEEIVEDGKPYNYYLYKEYPEKSMCFHYLAPELKIGNTLAEKVAASQDIYSFGYLLKNYLEKICGCAEDNRDHCFYEIHAIANRMTHPLPSERPSLSELIGAINKVLHPKDQLASPKPCLPTLVAAPKRSFAEEWRHNVGKSLEESLPEMSLQYTPSPKPAEHMSFSPIRFGNK